AKAPFLPLCPSSASVPLLPCPAGGGPSVKGRPVHSARPGHDPPAPRRLRRRRRVGGGRLARRAAGSSPRLLRRRALRPPLPLPPPPGHAATERPRGQRRLQDDRRPDPAHRGRGRGARDPAPPPRPLSDERGRPATKGRAIEPRRQRRASRG